MENKALLLTCGVILTDGKQFLIGRSHINHIWDIPKGIKHPNEDPIDAALRELQEETGIVAEKKDLLDVGRYTYRPEKDAHLFLYYRRPLVPINDLTCTTFVKLTDDNSEPIPEMDQYKYISFQEIELYLGYNMQRVLRTILGNYLEGWIEQNN